MSEFKINDVPREVLEAYRMGVRDFVGYVLHARRPLFSERDKIGPKPPFAELTDEHEAYARAWQDSFAAEVRTRDVSQGLRAIHTFSDFAVTATTVMRKRS